MPNYGSAWFNLAMCEAQAGLKERARRDLLQAIRLDPQHPLARRELEKLQGSAVV